MGYKGQPTLQSIYDEKVIKRAHRILNDPTGILHSLHQVDRPADIKLNVLSYPSSLHPSHSSKVKRQVILNPIIWPILWLVLIPSGFMYLFIY